MSVPSPLPCDVTRFIPVRKIRPTRRASESLPHPYSCESWKTHVAVCPSNSMKRYPTFSISPTSTQATNTPSAPSSFAGPLTFEQPTRARMHHAMHNIATRSLQNKPGNVMKDHTESCSRLHVLRRLPWGRARRHLDGPQMCVFRIPYRVGFLTTVSRLDLEDEAVD